MAKVFVRTVYTRGNCGATPKVYKYTSAEHRNPFEDRIRSKPSEAASIARYKGYIN